VAKNKIIIEFDDEKDCNEVLAAMARHNEMTWNYDTKKAMIKVFKEDNTILVSKSVYNIPQPIRL